MTSYFFFLSTVLILSYSDKNSSKVENSSNVQQQQIANPATSQQQNTSTMSRQPNGIWKTVDKAAMNRVGQRYAYNVQVCINKQIVVITNFLNI